LAATKLEPRQSGMRPSILYAAGADNPPRPLADHRFATDLNLDLIFAAVNAGREQLDLASVFYAPLGQLDDVSYRHEVLADLERPPVLAEVKEFGRRMRQSSQILAQARSLRSHWQEERLFVDAVSAYCGAVISLASALSELRPCSRGMRAFAEYLSAYRSSRDFMALADDAGEVVTKLGTVRYALNIKGTRVTVAGFRDEPDYATEIETFFAKFSKGEATAHAAPLPNRLNMNEVEAEVLELVARLNPGPFEALDEYFRRHQGFLDAAVSAFYRDSQFYLAYLDYIEPLRQAGLPFCYPNLSVSPGRVQASDAFDLALAAKVALRPSPIVTNDFDLGPDKRVMVITGPNSGGKTTFARAFGQLHYLASLGLPVPAREANLVLADAVLASFAQAERLGTGRSHLEEELVHLHGVIAQASPRSVIVLNESFSSTTLRDATLLGRAVLAQLVARGSLCAFVTFVDELATANEATISMVAAVHPDDPAQRTYKIFPKPPGGLAYAAALAERYGLSYRAVSEQVAKENRPADGEDQSDGLKVLLMHPSEDFKLDRELPPESDGLVEDLGLSTLFEAMAKGDKFLLAVGKAAVLSPLVQPSEIVYRQEVLTDCLAHPEFAKQLYSLATEAVESHKKVMSWGLTPTPESLHYISLHALELLLGYLVRLRRVTAEEGSEMASSAFVRLRSLVLSEFDDAYLKLLKAHLDELRPQPSVWMSAQLGRANKGTGYVLQRPPVRGRRERLSRRGQIGFSFTVRDDDDKRLRALDELKARGIIVVANTIAQSVDNVVTFFSSLRSELAFYIGCLNLESALVSKGEPICTPVPMPADSSWLRATGLYDPGLSLRMEGPTVGNELSADNKALIVVTGANRGGKTTFLRSVGLAHLMMQCGMFVAARSFGAGVRRRVFTHFRRDEDRSMAGGKLDEELARMSTVLSHISPGCLLLSNEPFASTNEREGSHIARQVFLPLASAGVLVVVVTHLVNLAESLYEDRLGNVLFLRAPRQTQEQQFKLLEGAPEPTAYGEDVYKQVFGEFPAEVLGAPSSAKGQD
jgi:DNA mismatch repair ATPase MutS